MSKEKREEQVKVINSLLELKREVVGVKFYYDEEEYAACPAQQVKYYIPYCVTVRGATAGHDIKIRKENIGCFAAARVLGMDEVTESYRSGEDCMGLGMYSDQQAAKKAVDNISINPKCPCGIEISPLELMEKDPDVVIVVSTPYNIMRLIQGYSYYYGSYKGFKMAGNQAMCAEITACTYVTNEINTSMMCSGTRFLSKWQKDEMAMGIPGDKYEKVIQGVYHTADPLERDADKERIKKAFEENKMQAPDIHMGKNYDTNHYHIGETGIRSIKGKVRSNRRKK